MGTMFIIHYRVLSFVSEHQLLLGVAGFILEIKSHFRAQIFKEQ